MSLDELETKTNYLSEQDLMKLHWGMERLDTFSSSRGKHAMTADMFIMLIQTAYECGLGIGDVLKIRKSNIDLIHRILTIRAKKTLEVEKKTTITPFLAKLLQIYLDGLPDDAILFPCNRQIVWRYVKDAGNLSGLPIFEAQYERDIEGVWTNLFAKSCSKRMHDLGANKELKMCKLGHDLKYISNTSEEEKFNALLKWEEAHLPLSRYQIE